MTEFIARNHGHSCFEIIIKTTDEGHYEAAQSFARQLIDNGVATTEDTNVLINADRIRAMSDEELEKFIRNIAIHFEPWCDNHCKMDGDEDCNKCLANWLKQPVKGE